MSGLQRDIEEYASQYLKHDFEEVMVKYRRQKVLEVLNRCKPHNILEIGCGIDSIANYFTDFDNFTIIEPSERFIRQAIKNRSSKINVICDFFENKIDDLKKQEFDFIIISSLLHEVNSPEVILNCARNVSNQRTLIHINVPNSHSFHPVWAYESGLIQSLGNLTETAKSLQQNTAFDLQKLSDLVLASGFKIIDKGSYFIKPFNHSKMQGCLENNFINERLLDGLYKMTKYIPDMGAEIYLNCRVKCTEQ